MNGCAVKQVLQAEISCLFIQFWRIMKLSQRCICACLQSLPAGERGLKYAKCYVEEESIRSLPAGERGLKYLLSCESIALKGSLPAGERGLKLL